MLVLYVLNVSKIFRVVNDDFLNLTCSVGLFLAANVQSFLTKCLAATLGCLRLPCTFRGVSRASVVASAV